MKTYEKIGWRNQHFYIKEPMKTYESPNPLTQASQEQKYKTSSCPMLCRTAATAIIKKEKPQQLTQVIADYPLHQQN
jgi:hypothetical protein